MPILNTSRKEEERKRKNMNTSSFLLSPITYRNLFENEAIEELPILEKVAVF
jgi:hypothetical protein